MKKYIIRMILIAIIIAITYFLSIKIGSLTTENKIIVAKGEKEIIIKEKIIYVKDKQREIVSEPINDASTDHFLRVWREKRARND